MRKFKEQTEFLASKKLKEKDLLNYLVLVYQPELLKEKSFNIGKMFDKGYEFKPSRNINKSYGAFHDRYESLRIRAMIWILARMIIIGKLLIA